MPENRQYRLFASFCRSFIIFEFLPLIEPAALRIPLQLTLLLWWYCRRANAAHSLAVALRCPAACIGLHLGNAPDHCPNRCLGYRFFLQIVAQLATGVKFRQCRSVAHFPMMPRNVNRQGSVAAIWCKFLPYILWLYLTFSGNFYFAPFLPTALQLVRKTELQAEGRNLRVFEARVWGEQNYVGTNL